MALFMDWNRFILVVSPAIKKTFQINECQTKIMVIFRHNFVNENCTLSKSFFLSESESE